MSRRLIMAGNAGSLPSDGLVFYASFRENLIAETGQALSGGGRIIVDETLGRQVMDLAGGAVTFSSDGLPEGDQPFSIACKVCLPHGHKDGFFVFGWGSTPYSSTVAGLACSSSGIALRNWGALRIGNVTGTNWHHLAATYDGSTARFYVDGHLDSSAGISGLTTGNETGSFGTWWAGDSTPCRYANARIYNRALSDAEIIALAKEV